MLQQKILKTIQKYNLIQKGDKVVVGVSGGPDSMCLLDILCLLKEKLHIEIVVAHINHMMRKEAEEETKYVQEYCKKMQISCFVKYADVTKMAREQKLGTEEMGRKVRYEFFEEVAQKINANKIATAHNANDNVETVLMNLLRGSGTSGLKGIEIQRESSVCINYTDKCQSILENEDLSEKQNTKVITYIRPLRECERAEIEQYCEERQLEPKMDKSNLENIYTRNKIRNELIPYLQKEFNPNIVQTLNRLSDLAKEEDKYFKQIVQEEYETLKMGENEKDVNRKEQLGNKKNGNRKEQLDDKKNKEVQVVLDLKKFNNLPKVIKSKVLLYTINKVLGTTQGIEKVNIEDIIKLCNNNIGNKYLMPNKNIKIFVKKGKIFFIAI